VGFTVHAFPASRYARYLQKKKDRQDLDLSDLFIEVERYFETYQR
jgi:hypothetical protein